MTEKNEDNSKLELLEKLETRIDEVEDSMNKLTKQIIILMSELSSPFAVNEDENQ